MGSFIQYTYYDKQIFLTNWKTKKTLINNNLPNHIIDKQIKLTICNNTKINKKRIKKKKTILQTPYTK